MQFFTVSQLSVIPKSFLFSLLLTLSWASTAQDFDGDSLNAISVEVEQVNINHADAPTIARMQLLIFVMNMVNSPVLKS